MRPDGEVNPATVVKNVAERLRKTAEKEGKSISLNLVKHSPMVIGSADELTQVFQNLLENALKYSRDNSEITVKMYLEKNLAGMSGPALVTEIRDESEGIAQEHISRLTERFYRVDSHRSRKKGGTGLGLAIVKHIINRHRGRLLIKSEIGKGSNFSVALPVETK